MIIKGIYYSLLVPLAGVTGGVIILKEPLSHNMILGAILMIIGTGIIVIRKPLAGKAYKD
jgi:O-acetylserine/cysteine efflux transporter